MGVQHLLRKSAIEKMSSPEQLDMAMRVTSPVSWIALSALGALVLAAVVFSIVGRIPVRVSGSGIIMRGEGVESIEVPVNARVDRFFVETGELVEEGQFVAQLDLGDLEAKIRTTKDRITDLETQVASRQSSLDGIIGDLQSQLNSLYRRRKQMQGLVAKRIKTRNDLLQIDAQISSLKAQIRQQELGESPLENQLAEQRRSLANLEDQFEASARVVSPVTGRVSAILKREGQLIRQGERLINLEDPKAPFRVLLFVPFGEGKKIATGMPVKISPSTVKPEEYGYILGTIDQVSSQAVTFQEVSSTLNNDSLAQRFAQDTPFRVDAAPTLDPVTVSGFQWTSGSGPPDTITGNTPCDAQIIVDTKRPISYVIPTVKKALGVG